MENLLSVFLGIGLSAACGFRVFIPLLAMSIASLFGHLTLSHGFEWIATYPALVVFATASVLEIAAYYIPLVDNLMDSIAGPAAVVAGILVAASSMIHMDPLLKWTLAIIAGGGTAAIFHGSTALVRGASTALTGGIGNPAVATAALGIAAGLSILAIALPLLSIIVICAVFIFMIRKGFRKLLKPKRTEGASL
jgi:Domain of unknown function (DUF4126)